MNKICICKTRCNTFILLLKLCRLDKLKMSFEIRNYFVIKRCYWIKIHDCIRLSSENWRGSNLMKLTLFSMLNIANTEQTDQFASLCKCHSTKNFLFAFEMKEGLLKIIPCSEINHFTIPLLILFKCKFLAKLKKLKNSNPFSIFRSRFYANLKDFINFDDSICTAD